MQVKEVMDAMAVDTAKAGLGLGSSGAALKVDGGMTSNEPLMQFQADLLGTWRDCGSRLRACISPRPSAPGPDRPTFASTPSSAGVPLLRPRSAETTALGAALAAGLGVGYWSSLDELKKVYVSGKTWGPAMTGEERARQMGNWKKAVTRSMGWVDGKEEAP
jgi:glycerol kinase